MNIIHARFTQNHVDGSAQCFITQDTANNLSVAFVMACGAPIGTPMRYWVNAAVYKGLKSAIHLETDEADFLDVSRECLSMQEIDTEEQMIAIAQDLINEHLNKVYQ